MKVNWRENKHFIASGAAHVAIPLVFLLLGLFTSKPFLAEASSGMPVDVISASEFNQMTKPNKVTSPKPVVEKKAPESKPVEIRDAEISDLPDIKAPAPQASVPPPAAPPPEPQKEAEKPPEPKKAEKPPEPKPPEPKKVEKPPEPEKPDAEALARAAIEKQRQEAAKAEAERKKAEQQRKLAEQKKIEEQKRAEEKKRAEQERIKLAKLAEQKSEDKSSFDSNAIQNLLDKRKPRRQAATGEEVNNTASAPAAGSAGQSMSGNDWNRFIARMRDCWTPPDGQDVRSIAVVLRIRMNKDGTLSAEPQILDRVASSGFQVAADAALRAVKGCAPYTFMPTAKYEQWKDFEINFDPRQMNRG